MSFDQYNQFQKMEDPEDRKAEDLAKKKPEKRGYKKKSTTKSVSLKTYNTGTSIAGLLVWLIFIGVVAFGTYLFIQQFSQGG